MAVKPRRPSERFNKPTETRSSARVTYLDIFTDWNCRKHNKHLAPDSCFRRTLPWRDLIAKLERVLHELWLSEFAWHSLEVFVPIYDLLCEMMALHGGWRSSTPRQLNPP
jgi:hypothetical protein